MLIRILTNKVFPHGLAAAERIRCYVNILLEAENQVIITSFNGKSSVKMGLEFLNHDENVKIEAVEPRKYASGLIRTKKAFLKFLQDLNAKKEREDLVLVYGFLPSQQRVIGGYYKHLGIPVVLELNELPFSGERTRWDKLLDLRSFRRRYFIVRALPAFNGVIAISETLKNLALTHYDEDCVLKLPILVMPEKFGHENEPPSGRIKNKPYILHSGSMSEIKDGILAVLEAWSRANRILQESGMDMIYFHTTNLHTNNITKWKIDELLEQYGMRTYFIVTGRLTDEELVFYMEHAILHILNKPNSLQNRYNFPTKLGEYLLSGVPVVCGAESNELVNYVTHEKDIYLVEPNNVEELCKGILDIYRNVEFAKSLTKEAQNLAESAFTVSSNKDRLNKFLLGFITASHDYVKN
jgi:glycosyltransferase involved in cell wall biosynthesis